MSELLTWLLIIATFIAALAALVWALPLERMADWLDRNDRTITSLLLVFIGVCALLWAGSLAIR